MNTSRFSLEDILQLHERFSNQSLSKSEWTHEAHLLVALSFLKNHNLYEALCRLKAGIILLNRAHQTTNNGNGGYHETLTVFWSNIIDLFIRMNPDTGIMETAELFFTSKLTDRSLPFLLQGSIYRTC
jgi:UDP-3-O-[3-hydroxymyristoyl] glucosamine N-acyltransferase